MSGNQLLSDIVVYNKYAKYNKTLKRRETWEEIVDRYKNMMIKKYPTLSEEIVNNIQFIYDKKVLPSMRALQFAGAAIEKNESRINNCAYLPIDDYRAFSEVMFLLLGGTGVGYSVQKHHVNKLPDIKKGKKQVKYLIPDSIEGWADAVKALMKGYFGITKTIPRFDYSEIRPRGAELKTAGGKAPGPEPLRIALTKVESILREKMDGDKLTDFECHRICCLLADAVLAGGIRRAALISLFSLDSDVMISAKAGNWWELYPELGRANNSAVILRNRVKKDEFLTLWKRIKDSGSGEPGFVFTNDVEFGCNPCCEISLRAFTFCNLCEINGGKINSQEDLNIFAKVAAFFGTLQAGFTDFHYLRPIWKTNTEKDALIGPSITGICNGNVLDLDLKQAANIVKIENEEVAFLLGINSAARTTTIKPAGTTSCVLGTSSGIHAWHSKFYIRNMQCRVGDDLFNYFMNNHSELIQIMEYDKSSAVIGIPQIAPKNAIVRNDENAILMLERVKHFSHDWVKEGHNRGPNTNNVSATVSIKENEWKEVAEWMWENKNSYNGLSVLPYDGGTYSNAPFEEVSKEVWDRKMDYIKNNTIDLTQITEIVDNTVVSDTIACGPGGCDIV